MTLSAEGYNLFVHWPIYGLVDSLSNSPPRPFPTFHDSFPPHPHLQACSHLHFSALLSSPSECSLHDKLVPTEHTLRFCLALYLLIGSPNARRSIGSAKISADIDIKTVPPYRGSPGARACFVSVPSRARARKGTARGDYLPDSHLVRMAKFI